MRRKIAAGNWKMNGSPAALAELEALAPQVSKDGPDVVICPPSPLLYRAAQMAKPIGIHIGAQDCHMQDKGAFTGDISATMVAESGASHVIVGHSERRSTYGETDSHVHQKIERAWAADLTAILCIGESGDDRAAGETLDIIGGQLAGSLPDATSASNTVVAYEPIWAIGTGVVPELDQIIEVHDFLRAQLIQRFGDAIGSAIPLLYGGSVKPDNAATIFEAENVDGALVGGASLKASDFAPIIAALAAS